MKAVILDKDQGNFVRTISNIDLRQAEDGEMVIDTMYSSLNYKDALAITNSAPVVRTWPMVPGIDGAGLVRESRHPSFKPGDPVLINGWGTGETHWGCLAEQAVLMGDWLLPLPPELDSRRAMAIGTAGYTAMLCVMAIEAHGTKPGDGEILVTGASGGVGSFALTILSQLGFRPVASTGRTGEADYLGRLGAVEIIDRAQFAEPGRPLQKERWAAVVDAVGGVTLANACASTRYGGIVAACGMAQSLDLPLTVAPFILRGVTLAGIDSVMAPQALRRDAWRRIAGLDLSILEAICQEVKLDDVIPYAEKLLAGRVRGRIVVKVTDA